MKRITVAIMVLGAGLALLPAAAVAQTRRHVHVHSHAHVRVVRVVNDPLAYEAPPLTVRPPSYLDPGQVVPVGSTNQYVSIPSQPRNDLYDSGGLAYRYGDGTLPGPLSVPGRPVNILDYFNY
jgi:hypothetical protein